MVLGLVDVLEVQEHGLELEECDDFVLFDVVLAHDVLQVLLSDVVPYFIHRCHDVVRCDAARAVCVELVENGLQFVVIHEGLHVKRRHQELGVVYLFVAEVVHF